MVDNFPASVSTPGFSIYYLNERAVTIEFGSVISEDVWQQVDRLNELVTQNPFPGFCTTVPAYTTLSIFFDPMITRLADMPGRDCFVKVSGYINGLKDMALAEVSAPGEIVTIPVCYGGKFGPDLEELAALHNLAPSDVIKLHSDAVYKVYMIGFVPGFAYLGGLNKLLETPRKMNPRGAVPAGSVGIAGRQTGIYPMETPGGWQLIGKTPLKLFDAGRQQPSLLKAGDRVVFKEVNEQEFNHIANR